MSDFLAKKSWHVTNATVRRKVWQAEQDAKFNERKQLERQKEKADEERYWRDRKDLHQGKKSQIEEERRRSELDFMYIAPVGAQTVEKASAATGQSGKQDTRRKGDIHMTEKFPFLKGAPVEGKAAKNPGEQLNYKPFGVQLRDVKCLRCGQWGHRSVDRECPMRDLNPNDSSRQHHEDPLTLIQSRQQRLNASGEVDDEHEDEELKIKSIGFQAEGSSYDILPSSKDDSVQEDVGPLDIDEIRDILRDLPKSEQRRILKKLHVKKEIVRSISGGKKRGSHNKEKKRRRRSYADNRSKKRKHGGDD